MNRPTLRGGNTAFNAALWLILGAVFCFTGAAIAQTYTRQTTRVIRGQFDVARDNSGTVTAVNFNGFVQAKRVVNGADATDIIGDEKWTKVDFNLLNVGNTTAATKTINGIQAAALLQQMILDQATAQGVP